MSATMEALAASRTARGRQRMSLTIGRVALLAGFLALWQLLAMRGFVDAKIVASPSAIAQHLIAWAIDGTLLFHSTITIEETLAGFAIGAIFGLVLGFAIGSNRLIAELVDPFIFALYSIPKVALAPLFVVWFGIGIPMKIILAAVTVLFIVFYNTLAGVRNVEPALLDAMWLMGATRMQTLLRVVIPSALGFALTGVRIAIPYALIGAIIGELIASNRGIGYLIASSGSQYDTAGVFAALFVLTILAVVLNALVDLLERRLSAWKSDASVRV